MSAPADFWSDLEDIFTCIDLATNSGHNLGPSKESSGSRAFCTWGRLLASRKLKPEGLRVFQ
jgi:hypothetical protein